MNLKRIIAIILIMSTLLASISPISFAAYVYGPSGSGSYPITVKDYAWQHYTGSGGGSTADNLYIEPIEITVTQSGVYEISNLHGGDSTNYVICAVNGGSLAPLPVASYGNGSSGLDLTKYNNSSSNTTSVYLDANKTYQILLIGDSTGSARKLPSDSKQIAINVEYITPPEGAAPYETATSSLSYTSNIGIDPKLLSGTLIGTSIPVNLDSVCYQYPEGGSGISGDKIGDEGDDETQEDGDASWFEKLITWLGLSIAEGIRALLHQILKAEVSIDTFVFDNYSNTKLSIFSSIEEKYGENEYLEDSGIIDNGGEEGILTKYFNFFRGLAIAIYLVMLLAAGVMILLKSTGKDKEKYKSILVDWVKGIIILVFFPYIMKYTIVINNAIVDYFEGLKTTVGESIDMEISMPTSSATSIEAAKKLGLADSKKLKPADMMDYMRIMAWEEGRLAYFIVYAFLLKELIGFIYIYFKRLLTVLFLIFIFPLVTVSYAFDKVGNGKADAFGHWFKEFFLNVFLQAFQAANYIVIMPIIFILASDNSTVNVILLMIGITYISKGDVLLRSMFSKMSGGGAGTTKNLSEAVKTMVNVKIAKDVAKQVGGIGKRVGNLKNNVYDMKNKYYDLQDAKKYDRENKKAESEERWNNSYLNPEKRAIDDVEGNIKVALSELRTPEERKEALDRLEIAKNDPKRRELYEQAIKNMQTIDPVTGEVVNSPDLVKLDKLMLANNAINETINHNQGINGALTEREVNINANIIYDVMSGGSTGIYAGLYNWANSKNLTDGNGNNILRRDGSNVTIGSALSASANKRRLSDHEREQFEKVQNFMGNVTGMDTKAIATERVTRSAHGPLEVKEHSNSERVRARNIEKRFGTNSATGESKAKQERAANLVARMQSYKFMIDSGTSQGVSATEAKRLAAEWRELQNDSDNGVQNILKQVGDASITGDPMEANIGFTLEQFETMASLAVLSDTENLVGTEEEKQELINDSIGHLVKVAKDKDSDKVSKNMIQRAEIDSIIDDFYDDVKIVQNNDGTKTITVNVDASNYIRTNQSQEELRDRKEYDAEKARLERSYDYHDRRQSVAQARGNLIRSATRTAGSALSVGAIPLNVAAGTAGAALYAGASGDMENTTSYIGAVGVGMAAENTIESFVPGTVAANNNKNSVGNRLDSYANQKINSNLSYSDVEVNESFARQESINNSAKARIEKYKKYTK